MNRRTEEERGGGKGRIRERRGDRREERENDLLWDADEGKSHEWCMPMRTGVRRYTPMLQELFWRYELVQQRVDDAANCARRRYDNARRLTPFCANFASTATAENDELQEEKRNEHVQWNEESKKRKERALCRLIRHYALHLSLYHIMTLSATASWNSLLYCVCAVAAAPIPLPSDSDTRLSASDRLRKQDQDSDSDERYAAEEKYVGAKQANGARKSADKNSELIWGQEREKTQSHHEKHTTTRSSAGDYRKFVYARLHHNCVEESARNFGILLERIETWVELLDRQLSVSSLEHGVRVGVVQWVRENVIDKTLALRSDTDETWRNLLSFCSLAPAAAAATAVDVKEGTGTETAMRNLDEITGETCDCRVQLISRNTQPQPGGRITVSLPVVSTLAQTKIYELDRLESALKAVGG